MGVRHGAIVMSAKKPRPKVRASNINKMRSMVADVFEVQPSTTRRITVAYDSTGDLTGMVQVAFELAYDLHHGVHAPGAKFRSGELRAVWDGKQLRRV